MNILDFLSMYRAPMFAAAGEDGAGADSGDDGGKTESLMDLAAGAADDAGGDDAASGDDDAGADDGPHRPEGLPDHFMGDNDRATLDNVYKAYKGARDTIAKGSKGEDGGVVPDTAEGYLIEAVGDDDPIATELNSEDTKPVVDAFRAAALKMGMTDKTFQTFMREGMSKVAEGGISVGASQEEIQRISAEGERAELERMTGGKEAAQEIVNAVSNFGNTLIEVGAMSPDNLAEYNVMVGTAESAHIMHRIMTEYLGEKPVPLIGDGIDGQVTQEDAYAAHSAALSMPEGSEKTAALGKAERMFEKVYGNSPGSTVKSRVLS